MTLYRPHRRLLAEAMEEVVEITDKASLISAMMRGLWNWYPVEERPTLENVTVEPYAYDDRIKWDTYIVCVKGQAWGFTNGPVAD